MVGIQLQNGIVNFLCLLIISYFLVCGCQIQVDIHIHFFHHTVRQGKTVLQISNGILVVGLTDAGNAPSPGNQPGILPVIFGSRKAGHCFFIIHIRNSLHSLLYFGIGSLCATAGKQGSAQ